MQSASTPPQTYRRQLELAKYLGMHGTVVSWTKLADPLQTTHPKFVALIKLTTGEQILSACLEQAAKLDQQVVIELRKTGQSHTGLYNYDLIAKAV